MFLYVKTLFYIDALLLIGLLAWRSSLREPYRNIVRFRTVAIILLTPVVALFSRSINIYCVYLFCAAAFTSRSKADVCALYMLMFSLSPALLIHLSAGSLYLIEFTTLHAINLGALVGFLITRGKTARGKLALDILAWLPVIFGVIGAIADYKLTSFLRPFISYSILIIIPYFIISRSITTREELDRVMLYFMTGAVLASVVAVFEVLRTWPLYQPYQRALGLEGGISKTLFVRNGALRVTGPFLDSTALGMFLAVSLSVLPSMRHQLGRLAWFGFMGVMALGLLATQSRGAWVGAAAGLAVVMIARGRIGLLFGGGIAVAGAWMAKTMISNRPTDIHAAETAQYRLDLLKSGWRQFLNHPLFGQSRTSLEANMVDLTQGQGIIDFVNSHLYIALISGAVGLMAWLVAWATPAMISWSAARAARRDPGYPAGLVPLAMLATAFVSLTFTSMVDRNGLWLVLATALAAPCAAVTRQQMATRAARAGGQGGPAPARALGGRLPRPAVLLPR